MSCTTAFFARPSTAWRNRVFPFSPSGAPLVMPIASSGEDDAEGDDDASGEEPLEDDESDFDDFDDDFDDDFEEEPDDPDWDHPDEGTPEMPPGKKK